MPLEEVRMSPGMDTSDLIGSFEQEDPETDLKLAVRSFLDRITVKIARDDTSSTPLEQLLMLREALRSFADPTSQSTQHYSNHLRGIDTSRLGVEDSQVLLSTLSELALRCEEGRRGPRRFRWAEGPFLRALKEGHWLLLDDANLCPASVLDRFNSLFEDRGSLVLSERGMVDGEVPVIHPHPNFRAFMTMDPRYGELSRAMRNRGIEVYIASPKDAQPWPSADVARLQILRRDPFTSTSLSEMSSSVGSSAAHKRAVIHQQGINVSSPSGLQLAYSKFLIEDPDLFPASVAFASVASDLSNRDPDQLEAAAVQMLTNIEHSPALAFRLLLARCASLDTELVLMSINDSTNGALQLLSQSKSDPLGSHRLLELYIYALLMQAQMLRIQREDMGSEDLAQLSVRAVGAH